MSEVADQPVVEEFKSADFIANRNAADAARKAGKEPPAPVPGKPADKPVEAKVEPEDDDKDVEYHTPKLPRSVRRELNRLREELGETKGRLAAFQEFTKPKEAEKAAPVEVAEDPEPQRKDFPDDAQYNRALGRWEARQETTKVLKQASDSEQQAAEREAWFATVKEMDKKYSEDKKLIEDFDKVASDAVKTAEDDPTLQFVPDKQPTLYALIMESDVRAFMLHHFAKTPEDFRKILGAKPNQQINIFRRLEGKVEVMYTSTHRKQEAAQASAATDKKEATKDRHNPADGDEPGRTASERDVRKPRPSTEVAARGGSPPPEEPAVGSPGWMAKRNQAQYGR